MCRDDARVIALASHPLTVFNIRRCTMSTFSSQAPGSGRGNSDAGKSDAGKSAGDSAPQLVANVLAVPQKLMQINLEAATHAFNFMNRRMKAQAALWSSIGHLGDTNGAAEMQRAFIENVTKDYAEEMTELTNLARKNLASVTEATASAPPSGYNAARSS
jgi:sugar (pentulose or hexulose) kinase